MASLEMLQGLQPGWKPSLARMGSTILERLQHHNIWVNGQDHSTEVLHHPHAHIPPETLPEEKNTRSSFPEERELLIEGKRL